MRHYDKLKRFGITHQTSWDWRAAGNFIGGGTGSSLLVAAVIFAFPTALGPWPLLLAIACIGAGMLCVWTEIGRPWRAFNVLFHPQTSWMTREAFVAGLIIGLGALHLIFPALAVAGYGAGLAGLLFLFCQGRILKAAKGIPAWREPRVVPLIMSTGLAEGVALLALLGIADGTRDPRLLPALMLLIVWRAASWVLYHQRLQASDAPASTRGVLAGMHRVLLSTGTVLPLAAGGMALAFPAMATLALVVAALATLGSGWHCKLQLITQAAQVQGYALGNKLRRGHPLAGAR